MIVFCLAIYAPRVPVRRYGPIDLASGVPGLTILAGGRALRREASGRLIALTHQHVLHAACALPGSERGRLGRVNSALNPVWATFPKARGLPHIRIGNIQVRRLIKLQLVQLVRLWSDAPVGHAKPLVACASVAVSHLHWVIPHHEHGLAVGKVLLGEHHVHVLLLHQLVLVLDAGLLGGVFRSAFVLCLGSSSIESSVLRFSLGCLVFIDDVVVPDAHGCVLLLAQLVVEERLRLSELLLDLLLLQILLVDLLLQPWDFADLCVKLGNAITIFGQALVRHFQVLVLDRILQPQLGGIMLELFIGLGLLLYLPLELGNLLVESIILFLLHVQFLFQTVDLFQ